MKTFSGPPPPSPIISWEWGWTAWGFVWQQPFNSKTANNSMRQPGPCPLLADFEAAASDLLVPEGSCFPSPSCLLPSAGRIKLEWSHWCFPSFQRKLWPFPSTASWASSVTAPEAVWAGRPTQWVCRPWFKGQVLRQTWPAADFHWETQRWISVLPPKWNQETFQTIIPKLIVLLGCHLVWSQMFHLLPPPPNGASWHSSIHTNDLHKTQITRTTFEDYDFFFG